MAEEPYLKRSVPFGDLWCGIVSGLERLCVVEGSFFGLSWRIDRWGLLSVSISIYLSICLSILCKWGIIDRSHPVVKIRETLR